jgi:hypothetical protein
VVIVVTVWTWKWGNHSHGKGAINSKWDAPEMRLQKINVDVKKKCFWYACPCKMQMNCSCCMNKKAKEDFRSAADATSLGVLPLLGSPRVQCNPAINLIQKMQQNNCWKQVLIKEVSRPTTFIGLHHVLSASSSYHHGPHATNQRQDDVQVF